MLVLRLFGCKTDAQPGVAQGWCCACPEAGLIAQVMTAYGPKSVVLAQAADIHRQTAEQQAARAALQSMGLQVCSPHRPMRLSPDLHIRKCEFEELEPSLPTSMARSDLPVCHVS